MNLAVTAQIAPVTIDALSTVRYIHAASFRVLAASQFSEDEIEHYATYVYSVGYTDTLAQSIRAGQLLGATLGQELVGTAGWSAADDTGSTARLTSVHVRPMFSGIGLGRRLVTEAEDAARRAGFENFTLRALANAVGFFKKLGYEVSSHGVFALGPDASLPVVYMRKSKSHETVATTLSAQSE